MVKWIVSGVVVVGVLGAVLFFAIDGSAKKDEGLKTVAVTRGTITEKALAVGKIEPKNEISVKSKNGGIVRKIYAEVGTLVKIGDPLIDVQPDPTPVEYAEAKRQMELSQVSFDRSKSEYSRAVSLNEKQLISTQEFDRMRATYDEAELRLKMSTEKLALIESGRTEVANRKIDNIIKSPINGMILSRLVEEGDPVVPLTTYQAGTELMTLAYMENLIFKGNVDEIDVGKLHEGMKAEIEVGALSREKVTGTVLRISPKAHKEEGSTLFEIEIAIDDLGKTVLRAGYSANADIVIVKKDSVLMVPERLVKVEDSVSTIEVQDSLGVITPRKVKTGLSDGINIEITEGVVDSELVVERPPKEITSD
jgi:HlyD family secretion protein